MWFPRKGHTWCRLNENALAQTYLVYYVFLLVPHVHIVSKVPVLEAENKAIQVSKNAEQHRHVLW